MTTPAAGRAAAEGGGAGMGSRPAGTAGGRAVDVTSSQARGGAGAGAGSAAGGAGSKATMEAAGAPAVGGAGDNAGGSPASVTCPAMALATGRTTATLQVDGVARTYILYVPASYTGDAPVPLVTDWHPLMANGAAEELMSGYKALADQEGFIVAWPDALEGGWNIGPCCTRSGKVDDLGFARALVAEVSARACIDPKRVYATGISMGGGMSHYLACNAADTFAAVAPAAFDLLTEDEEPCHPARPIAVIAFRGTADPIVPYMGGASNPPNGLNVTIHFRGAEGTFNAWKELNGCSGMPVDAGNNCQAYTQCQDGVEVTLCSKPNGGHEAGDPKLGWAMLKKHPMP
jgi:polyhydroxybutyrate depolymerase